MLAKIALKNIKKSFKEYSIYFFTLAIGVCVFYMFDSIYAQKEIMEIAQSTNRVMEHIRQILVYVSIFVAIILGFLVAYANNFFIKRRKKELGIYITLGMERKNISKLLLIETLIIAALALIAGLILGVIGSQFMSFFTAKIFEVDMTRFKFIFSLGSIIKTMVCFSIIFLIIMILNMFVIGKCKVVDLIYGSRKNQEYKIKKFWIILLLFILSIIFISLAYAIIWKNGIVGINNYALSALLFVCLGTVLLCLSFSGILMKFIFSSKNIYFKNLNVFVSRQILSKINTNCISLSVISMLLVLAICFFSFGIGMQNIVSDDYVNNIPYDFSVYNNLDEDIKLLEGIDYSELSKYERDDMIIGNFDLDLSNYLDYFEIEDKVISFISLTDFNSALNLKGKESIDLPKDKYLVLYYDDVDKDLADQIVLKNMKIEFDKEVLYPFEKSYMERISNDNLEPINFIVNDEVLKNYYSDTRILNINVKDENKVDVVNQILEEKVMNSYSPFFYSSSKINIVTSFIETKAVNAFLNIYISIIFMLTCAAILAIQNISDLFDNKYSYDVLRKLGVEKRRLNKVLFFQVLFYFLFPLVIAIIHSTFTILAVNEFDKGYITSSVFPTVMFVLIIYGLYFYLTYSSSKNIINNKK